MRLLILILTLCTSLHSQFWVKWAGEFTTPDQREFALKCYEFGKQYGRGHTLAAIAWMESSLGRDTSHNESSSGHFGIGDKTRKGYNLSQGHLQRKHGRNALECDELFSVDAHLALQIFEDNIRYFRRLGYSPREAWYWASSRYVAGKHWDGEAGREYAWRFNLRVKALKEIFK